MNRRTPPPSITLIEAVLLAVSGAAAGAAFASRNFGFLMWLLLTPVFVSIWRRPAGFRRGGLVGTVWAAGFFLMSYRFMVELHPLTWRGLSDLESVVVAYGLAWIGLSLASALGFGVVGSLLGGLRPRGWRRVWLPAAAWMLWEWAMHQGPLAMPWNILAVSQVAYPALIQIGAVAGTAALAGLIVAVNAGLACVWVDWPKVGLGAWRYFALPILVAGANVAGGTWYLSAQPPIQDGNFRVGIVQGNVRPDVKWQPNALRGMYDTYARLTNAVAGDGISLVVWPETAMPVSLDQYPALKQKLRELAQASRVPILVGAIDRPVGSHGPYNAARLIRDDGDPSKWYYKRHLVPFGEFTPGAALLSGILPQLNALPEDIQAGQDAGILTLGGLRLGPMICYESIFPALARDSVKAGADVLVVITNDAWYKRSIALHQHLAQACLRAVETRRPVVRAANTGISALIDPYGRIQGQTPINSATTLSGGIAPRSGLTPYVAWGDWLVAVATLALAFACFRRPGSAT